MNKRRREKETREKLEEQRRRGETENDIIEFSFLSLLFSDCSLDLSPGCVHRTSN
jgi:hypothetical protein